MPTKVENNNWRTPNLQANAFLQHQPLKIQPMSSHRDVIRKWYEICQFFVSWKDTDIPNWHIHRNSKIDDHHEHHTNRDEFIASLSLMLQDIYKQHKCSSVARTHHTVCFLKKIGPTIRHFDSRNSAMLKDERLSFLPVIWPIPSKHALKSIKKIQN